MKRSRAIGAALLAIAIAGCSRSSESVERSNIALRPLFAAPRAEEFRREMRDVWSDHVVLTRDYIIAATSDDPDVDNVLSRLMTNQDELGATIVRIYGHGPGIQLSKLLKDHIGIAGELVAAAKEFDNEKLDEANRRWHGNAVQIANLLAGINPHWDRDDLVTMLNEHLALTADELNARVQGNWSEDQRVFARIEQQAAHMADAMADGILMHHPEMFG
jgi:hypothetical protein